MLYYMYIHETPFPPAVLKGGLGMRLQSPMNANIELVHVGREWYFISREQR